MKKNLVIALAFFTSCGVTYRIPKEDYMLVPYNGDETLIFKSNKGVLDTVFMQGKEKFLSPMDPLGFSIKRAEYYCLLSRRSSLLPVYGKKRYLDSLRLITLKYDVETTIKIDFTVRDGFLYGGSYRKNEFLSLKDTTLNIGDKKYNDVLVLKPQKTYMEKKDGKSIVRANSIYVLYWSKSNGIIRYDKASEYWELVNK